MMLRTFIVIVISALFLLGNGEAPRQIYVAENFEALLDKDGPFKIAVLPMQNMSMYPNIPYYFREHLMELLAAKGYSVIDSELVDASLRELGVQKADHIRLLGFDKLANMTSADAIMSGIIETATVQDAALYSGYAFAASLKLQTRDGTVIWYNLSQRVAKRRLSFDPFNIVFSFLQNREKDKHIDAIKAVAQNLTDELPDGPSEVVIDDLLNQAMEL